MKSALIDEVEKWVNEVHPQAKHLVRTGYWVKQIYPEADEALILAAVTHDIERAFKEGRNPPSLETKGARWDDKKYNLWHGERSAQFVKEFLGKNGANEELTEEVCRLVKHHEDGGWDKVDIIKDADSISFLEINADRFVAMIPAELSEEEVAKKFDYMWRRIGSSKAKEFARPFYERAMKKLDKFVMSID